MPWVDVDPVAHARGGGSKRGRELEGRERGRAEWGLPAVALEVQAQTPKLET